MEHVTSLGNIYQLLGFLIVAGLQVYTRIGVARLQKNQEVLVARHDAARAEMLRMAEHMFAHEQENGGDVAEAIKAALRVAYFQGQADVGTENKFPEERADAAVETLIKLAARVKPRRP